MKYDATLLEIAAISYSAISSLFFIFFISLGRIAKNRGLGNGVKCGIFNSFLLSALWPITALFGLLGWAYDIWQGWKKL